MQNKILNYLSTDPIHRKDQRTHGLAVVGPSGVGKSGIITQTIATKLADAFVVTTEIAAALSAGEWKKYLETLGKCNTIKNKKGQSARKIIIFLDDAVSTLSASILGVLEAYSITSRAYRIPLIMTDTTTYGHNRRSIYKAFMVVRLYRPYPDTVTRYLSKHISRPYAKRISALCNGDMRHAMRLLQDFKTRGNTGIDHKPEQTVNVVQEMKHAFDQSPPNYKLTVSVKLNDFLFKNYIGQYGDDDYCEPAVEHDEKYIGLTSAARHKDKRALDTLRTIATSFSDANLVARSNVSYLRIKEMRPQRTYGIARFQYDRMPWYLDMVQARRVMFKLTGSTSAVSDLGSVIRTFQMKLKNMSGPSRISYIQKLDFQPKIYDFISKWKSPRVDNII